VFLARICTQSCLPCLAGSSGVKPQTRTAPLAPEPRALTGEPKTRAFVSNVPVNSYWSVPVLSFQEAKILPFDETFKVMPVGTAGMGRSGTVQTLETLTVFVLPAMLKTEVCVPATVQAGAVTVMVALEPLVSVPVAGLAANEFVAFSVYVPEAVPVFCKLKVPLEVVPPTVPTGRVMLETEGVQTAIPLHTRVTEIVAVDEPVTKRNVPFVIPGVEHGTTISAFPVVELPAATVVENPVALNQASSELNDANVPAPPMF
jgi:hypothetical protein